MILKVTLRSVIRRNFTVESSKVKPFGCAIANFFVVKSIVSIDRMGWGTFRCYLHVASQSLTHLDLSCAYSFFKLILVLQIMF